MEAAGESKKNLRESEEALQKYRVEIESKTPFDTFIDILASPGILAIMGVKRGLSTLGIKKKNLH